MQNDCHLLEKHAYSRRFGVHGFRLQEQLRLYGCCLLRKCWHACVVATIRNYVFICEMQQ